MKPSRPVAALMGTLPLPAAAAGANPATTSWGDVLPVWQDAVVSGSRLIIYGTSALGIILVAYTLYVIATENDEDARWRAAKAGAIGSLFTIFGIIVGWISGILVP